jgi:hypothetical protein
MAVVVNNKPKHIFTYQTKCLINNKTYIGYHSTNNMNDGYIGCGIRSQAYANAAEKHGTKSPLIRAVVKHGYKNFITIPLCFFNTVEEAKEEERFLVTAKYINNNSNYNAQIGGKGGFPFSVDDTRCDLIINDYMSGMKKNDVMVKHGISHSVMYKITKKYNIKNRKQVESFITTNIQNWIKNNSCKYIDMYIKREITKESILKEIPFDLYKNNFLKGIKQDPLIYLINSSNEKIPISSSSELRIHTGIDKARIGLAIKFTKRGKDYRGFDFELNS